MYMSDPLPPRLIPDPPFAIAEIARFAQPWAMTFLPDGRLLVTEKQGQLKLLETGSGQVGSILGVPPVAVTVGIGGNTWAGGDNSVPYALTVFLPGSTMTLDGKPIVEKGALKL